MRGLIEATGARGAALEALVTAIVDAWEDDVFDERQDAYDAGWDAGVNKDRE